MYIIISIIAENMRNDIFTLLYIFQRSRSKRDLLWHFNSMRISINYKTNLEGGISI